MKLTSKLISVALLGAVAIAPAMGATGTTAARTLMTEAYAKAKREKKNVMVIFHASWCGWCKKMDAMLESPEFKSTFENSYVITHVDVLEQPAKKGLENTGGEEIMAQLGGKDAGLPFFAILSPEGKKLGDSMLPKTGNMGFPSAANEVAGFKVLLKNTAPKMRASDVERIETFLANSKSG